MNTNKPSNTEAISITMVSQEKHLLGDSICFEIYLFMCFGCFVLMFRPYMYSSICFVVVILLSCFHSCSRPPLVWMKQEKSRRHYLRNMEVINP